MTPPAPLRSLSPTKELARAMTHHFMLDRIEDGAVAVLEDAEGRFISIPAAWLPARVREGDVLRVDAEHPDPGRGEGAAAGAAAAVLTFTIDPEATARRRDEVRRLRDALPRAPDGDLSI